MKTSYTITPDFGLPRVVVLAGRQAWTLEQLADAGSRGCTPSEYPAPRWSAYVHELRKLDIPIETIMEPHAGAYPGEHGRYVLRARVRKGGQQ